MKGHLEYCLFPSPYFPQVLDFLFVLIGAFFYKQSSYMVFMLMKRELLPIALKREV